MDKDSKLGRAEAFSGRSATRRPRAVRLKGGQAARQTAAEESRWADLGMATPGSVEGPLRDVCVCVCVDRAVQRCGCGGEGGRSREGALARNDADGSGREGEKYVMYLV